LENIKLNKIWEGCKVQDRKAQNQLYQYFSKRMFVVCMRYAQTTLEAEDILQNGFIKVFTKHTLYTGKIPLENWIKRIMINTAIDIYRQNQNRQTESIEEKNSIHIESTIGTDQTSYKDLLNMIRELPIGYRTVFNLYIIEGYSHKEIADILNISEGSSKSQLSRARHWLQTKLQEHNY